MSINNLAVLYPVLIVEWDPTNYKSPNDYLPFSHEKVKWICSSENNCGCHKWSAIISSRTGKNKSGCPFCAGNRTCMHSNLEVQHPGLKLEWHQDNNPMCSYSSGSNKKVKWVCSSDDNCGCHIWEATIASRALRGRNCPFCTSYQVCQHNNLEVKFPHLKNEWHPDNLKSMDQYLPGSHAKILWLCKDNPCGCHIWEAAIYDRTTINPKGCPFCVNQKVCYHNSLEYLYPELKVEWHPDNKSMSSYVPGSGVKVNWICSNNSIHIWGASIHDRTGTRKTSCPHCSKSKGYSIKQIKWLTDIEHDENIYIQHAVKPEGEYKIATIGKVDGYCKDTNTVYEYHGKYFHGRPDLYDPDEINPTSKKSYGELYTNTMNRDERIKILGYNLIVMWEP